MVTIIWLVLGGTLLTIGDIIFKFWVERHEHYFSFLYIGGLLLYTLGAVFLIESYKTENIAVATAIFVIINIATLALMSWLYFGDKLSLMQTIGLFLAAIAIVFL